MTITSGKRPLEKKRGNCDKTSNCPYRNTDIKGSSPTRDTAVSPDENSSDSEPPSGKKPPTSSPSSKTHSPDDSSTPKPDCPPTKKLPNLKEESKSNLSFKFCFFFQIDLKNDVFFSKFNFKCLTNFSPVSFSLHKDRMDIITIII